MLDVNSVSPDELLVVVILLVGLDIGVVMALELTMLLQDADDSWAFGSRNMTSVCLA